MSEFLERLKQRKVVRWALAYLAAAWVATEVTGSLGDLFAIPLWLQRSVVVALAFGFLVTLALAWFHGEKGRQRVGGGELLILASILVVAGGILAWIRTGSGEGVPDLADAPADTSSGPSRSTPSSVAVLPFQDLSPDGDQVYFGDGLAEELRSALATVEGLQVASSTSSAAIRDAGLDPREIGSRLGVAHMVEGSVRKSGGRLRVDARLVGAEDGFQVWGERFDTDEADIFAVQDSIARSVARALEVELLAGRPLLLAAGQTDDHVAQDLYLKGRFAWNRRTEAGLAQAVSYFRQALERDSTYARALAGLADAYAVQGFYDYRPPSEAFPLAQASARAALRVDSTMAEPHATLGYAALYHDWNGVESEHHFRRAIALDPGYPVAHQWYANLLAALGRTEEAEREMRTASELDPLSMIAFAAIGWVHYYGRSYDEAVDQVRAALERDPSFPVAYLFLGQALEARGDLAEAETALRRAVETSGGTSTSRAALARVLGRAGRTDEARRILDDLRRARAEGTYVASYELAGALVATGQIESAFEELSRAVAERAHSVVFLGVDPQFDRIRGETRFRDLERRVGFGS